jgi:hypothetical protein
VRTLLASTIPPSAAPFHERVLQFLSSRESANLDERASSRFAPASTTSPDCTEVTSVGGRP